MLLVARKHTTRKRRRLWLAVLLCVAVLFLLEWRLSCAAGSVAEVHAQSLAVDLIHQSVADVLTEGGYTPDDWETITYGTDNSVVAVAANAVAVNRLKADVTLRIQDNLSGIRNHRVDVPLGMMLGGGLFSGLGPSLPVYISLSGVVRTDFESTFEDGGVNQAVHKLSMHITADITIVMPLGTVSTVVDTSVLLGEVVIVGAVPSVGIMSGSQCFDNR